MSSFLPLSKPRDVLPAYLVPNTCVSCLWGDLERSTDNKSHRPSGQRAACVTDTLLHAPSLEGGKQAASRTGSFQQLRASCQPLCSQPQRAPFGSGTAWPPVPASPPNAHLAHRVSSMQEGQAPSWGCLLGLAMEGGKDLGAGIQKQT